MESATRNKWVADAVRTAIVTIALAIAVAAIGTVQDPYCASADAGGREMVLLKGGSFSMGTPSTASHHHGEIAKHAAKQEAAPDPFAQQDRK